MSKIKGILLKKAKIATLLLAKNYFSIQSGHFYGPTKDEREWTIRSTWGLSLDYEH